MDFATFGLGVVVALAAFGGYALWEQRSTHALMQRMTSRTSSSASRLRGQRERNRWRITHIGIERNPDCAERSDIPPHPEPHVNCIVANVTLMKGKRKRVAIGLARRNPSDADDPMFGRCLAIYRAIGLNFGWPWRCRTCGKGGTQYRQTMACRRNRHTIQLATMPAGDAA